MTTHGTCGPAPSTATPSRASTASTSRNCAAGIERQDVRGGLRWMGLYAEREQGYDGSWSGDENADVHEAEHFMMRVRGDGGALTTQALRTVGELSTELARDPADISDRENVQ